MFTAGGYEATLDLHEGGGSIIYRGIRCSDRHPVILKVLKAQQPPPEVIARFKREYMLMRALALPGVVDAYDYLQTENHWIIVEEDFGGESLARLKLAGRLAVDRFLELGVEITATLAALHRAHVIHKDMNPSNIVMNPATGVVKIIDFGISASKIAEETVAFEHPTLLEGTPAYLSPEQTGRVNRPLDHRTDLYSLGCTFYELLTSELPFPTGDLLELLHCHLARAPRPPAALRPEIPPSLSAIVLKLMAKSPDDRYQSAHGVRVDLLACRDEQRHAARGAMSSAVSFDLGRGDVAAELRLPAKLYGRAREVGALLAAFDRVSAGETSLVLVTGYSGVGKSSVVRELYGPITARRGFFVAGKFEQYERNTPYAPVVQALQGMVQQLLCESADQIAAFRERLLSTAGPGCAVLIEVVPQLELCTGPLAPPPPLPPSDTHFRFLRAMRELVRAFARPEHPLVLFLDDLQWSDGASLDFIKNLVAERVAHLLIVGAYRDNEVGPGHPLSLALRDVPSAEYLRLAPLGLEDVTELIGDALRVGPATAAPLAAVVHDKTRGNPFFAGELLKALHADALIRFDHESGAWEWDTARIQARDISENVVELLIDAMHKLPPETQALLRWAACLGNRFDLRALAAATDERAAQIAAELMPAVSEGFVLPLTGNYRLFEAEVEDLERRVEVEYKFAHDRIQQAAYMLVPEEERRRMHLHLGRRLREDPSRDLLAVVNQLDMAGDLVTDRAERFDIARLNLRAGEKARSAAAHAAAFRFFVVGLSFLAPAAVAEGAGALRCADAAAYAEDYELSLKLTERAAEAAYLTADFEAMDKLAGNALSHARNWEDKAATYETRISALSAQSKLGAAIDAAREILVPLGVELPLEPTPAHIDAAIREVDVALQGRSPESLAALPPAAPASRHVLALRILDSIHLTTQMTQPLLAPIMAAKMAQLAIQHGNSEESSTAYVFHGIHLCERNEIERGYQFCRVARALCVAGHARTRFADVTANGFYHVFHLKEPIRNLIEDLKKEYRAGLDAGRLQGGLGCLANVLNGSFLAGVELEAVEDGIRQFIAAAERLGQRPQATWLRVFLQCVLNIMHEQKDPCVLRGEAYDEEISRPVHEANNDDITIQLVHILKAMLCFRFGKNRESVHFFKAYVEGRYPASGVLLPPATMYCSLAQLAICPEEASASRDDLLEDVRRKQRQMKIWADHGPMNYGHKYHLVEAELARVLREDSKARDHFDLAIDLARQHQYLNEESLALERAASFFRDRGRLRLAGYYLRDAYYACQRWGAGALQKKLKLAHPELLAASDRSVKRASTTSSGQKTLDPLATGDQPDVDLETVLRTSRAISAEHDPARLLEYIMSICLKHAGARRGFLILVRRDELIVKARGVLHEEPEIELVSEALEDQVGLSHGIIHYVARTLEPVVLDDAAEEGLFKADPHVRAGPCRSVLCLPVVYQGALVGIIYMENNQTAGAFKADQLEVLRLLMAQAAVSIENALLKSAHDEGDFQFSVGGSLTAHTPSYVLRQADRDLVQRIHRGDFCYVFNARQMGKSSLRVHTMDHLRKAGVRCAAVDLTSIGADTVTVEQWYAGVARALVSGLGLGRVVDLRAFWRDRAFLPPAQRLHEIVDEVLARTPDPIAVFVDEIDTVMSLSFSLDDFFALLRSFYNKRAEDPRYERLTFVLFGVATPTDLVHDRTRTPFNIGHAIPLTGFRHEEARALARGLVGMLHPDLVLKSILAWTDGQPFLTQKLCQLARTAESRPPEGKERDWVASLVRERVLHDWRSRDEPEHLKTIEARVLRSQRRDGLLKLYHEVLAHGAAAAETPLESELLLSGLVVREWGRLRVGNPIYASVFDAAWTDRSVSAG
jgi:predicted ATPase